MSHTKEIKWLSIICKYSLEWMLVFNLNKKLIWCYILWIIKHCCINKIRKILIGTLCDDDLNAISNHNSSSSNNSEEKRKKCWITKYRKKQFTIKIGLQNGEKTVSKTSWTFYLGPNAKLLPCLSINLFCVLWIFLS